MLSNLVRERGVFRVPRKARRFDVEPSAASEAGSWELPVLSVRPWYGWRIRLCGYTEEEMRKAEKPLQAQMTRSDGCVRSVVIGLYLGFEDVKLSANEHTKVVEAERVPFFSDACCKCGEFLRVPGHPPSQPGGVCEMCENHPPQRSLHGSRDNGHLLSGAYMQQPHLFDRVEKWAWRDFFEYGESHSGDELS